MTVVRAIDVGYGNTKFTTTDGTSGADIECRMFPSVAPVGSRRDIDAFLDKKDSVLVQVADATYEVGRDAMLGMASNASRTLDLDFPRKDSYLALVRGALHYMGVERVDHLIVGLPVSNMEVMAQPLAERLTGLHDVAGKSVTVGAVRVVPQPVGGLYDYGVRNQVMRQLESGNNLLLDPGYLTLDWVVTNGTKMVGVRSGSATNAGMSALLRAIAESVSARVKQRDGKTLDVTESVLGRLDEALRTTGEFRLNGKPERLEDHKQATASVLADALNKMKQRVGSLADIDRVIIVGGSAHLYQQAVCELFAGYDVRVAKDSVYANVRGFQLMGNVAAGLVAPQQRARAA